MKDSRKQAFFTAPIKSLRNKFFLFYDLKDEIAQVGTQMVEKLANKTLRVVTTTVLLLLFWRIVIIHFYQFSAIWTIIINLNTLDEILLFIFQNSPYVMEKEFGPEVTHKKYKTLILSFRMAIDWGWCWWQRSQLPKHLQNLFWKCYGKNAWI